MRRLPRLQALRVDERELAMPLVRPRQERTVAAPRPGQVHRRRAGGTLGAMFWELVRAAHGLLRALEQTLSFRYGEDLLVGEDLLEWAQEVTEA